MLKTSFLFCQQIGSSVPCIDRFPQTLKSEQKRKIERFSMENFSQRNYKEITMRTSSPKYHSIPILSIQNIFPQHAGIRFKIPIQKSVEKSS